MPARRQSNTPMYRSSGNVATEHDQADGQRRGDDEPHRPPEPGPEGEPEDERNARNAEALPVQDGPEQRRAAHREPDVGPGDERRLSPARGRRDA